LRYEAAHPTVTARIPAKAKRTLDALLKADGLSFSEWVQARVAGAADTRHQAMAEGRQAGYRDGLAEGRVQGRTAYLIMAAAMLWEQYGERLGNTDDSWIDKKAVECASAITEGQRQYLRSRLERTPRISDAVRRWVDASGIPEAGL